QAELQQRRVRVGGDHPTEDDPDHQHLREADVEEPRPEPLPGDPLEPQAAAWAAPGHPDPASEELALTAHGAATPEPPSQQHPGRQAHALIVTDPTPMSTVHVPARAPGMEATRRCAVARRTTQQRTNEAPPGGRRRP